MCLHRAVTVSNLHGPVLYDVQGQLLRIACTMHASHVSCAQLAPQSFANSTSVRTMRSVIWYGQNDSDIGGKAGESSSLCAYLPAPFAALVCTMRSVYFRVRNKGEIDVHHTS